MGGSALPLSRSEREQFVGCSENGSELSGSNEMRGTS